MTILLLLLLVSFCFDWEDISNIWDSVSAAIHTPRILSKILLGVWISRWNAVSHVWYITSFMSRHYLFIWECLKGYYTHLSLAFFLSNFLDFLSIGSICNDQKAFHYNHYNGKLAKWETLHLLVSMTECAQDDWGEEHNRIRNNLYITILHPKFCMNTNVAEFLQHSFAFFFTVLYNCKSLTVKVSNIVLLLLNCILQYLNRKNICLRSLIILRALFCLD